MNVLENEFSCQRDGLTIRGRLFIPEEGNNLPVIIISHGFMANMESTRHYAMHFARLGWLALCYDFCGGCVKGSSDGSSQSMSVLTEVQDLKAVLAYAKTLPEADPENLTLMGCSQGGLVSALVSAELGSEISQQILFYPAFCIPDDARRGHMMMAKFDPQNIPDEFRCGPMLLGRCYAESVMEMDPYQAIKGTTARTLIVHGTADKLVKASYSVKAKEAYGKNAQLKLIEGAGHGYRGNADELAIAYASEFLQGRIEILTVDLKYRFWDSIVDRSGLYAIRTIPLAGTADSVFFRGEVRPDSIEVQKWFTFKNYSTCAEIYLYGIDCAGMECTIRLEITKMKENAWEPIHTTDSQALRFLNRSTSNVVVEEHGRQRRVHVFSYAGAAK